MVIDEIVVNNTKQKAKREDSIPKLTQFDPGINSALPESVPLDKEIYSLEPDYRLGYSNGISFW